jgi:serine phosphatase RsbU (regulator of sigma subunit)
MAICKSLRLKRGDLFLQQLLLTFVSMTSSTLRNAFILVLIVSFNLGFGSSVNRWQDSILKVLPNLTDTSRVIALNKLSSWFSDIDLEKSKQYANEALHLSDSILYAKGRVNSRDNLGYVFLMTAQYPRAISIYKEAISIAQKINFTIKLAWLFNRLSAAYYYQGDYEVALQNYVKTSEYAKKTNNKNTLIEAYNGMASIYMAKSDFSNTEKYYEEALTIAHDIADTSTIALIENNLGVMYGAKHNYNESMMHYKSALEIYQTIKDSSSIALALVNIGNCNSSMGILEAALKSYNQALDIYFRSNDKNGLALCYTDIGVLFSHHKDFSSAIEFFNKALEIANEIGRKEVKRVSYQELANIYYQTAKYQKAYDYYKMYSDMKDSLFNESNARSMNEIQTKYETEKKENEIVRLNLQSEAQTARNKQRDILTYFIATALLLVLVIVFVVYRQNKITQKTNKELVEMNGAIRKQKRQIENQKLIVENQNKEITDSINYARQIQQAILPSDLVISKALPDHFILYKPKAIVSGDFYFFAENKNNIFMAAVDCTGHGVPGAFMSMIGHNLLTQIINEKDINDPGEILNQLHKSVRHVLQQDSEKAENRDGMDIALMAISKNFKTLEYAGANRPLYLVRENVIKETKGDKFPIGGLQYELERKFSTHSIKLQKKDTIYLFSDGYADQFGGEKGKKFMVKNLQKTLLDVHSLPLNKQKDKLDTVIESWRGNLEQIDDILLIGVEI